MLKEHALGEGSEELDWQCLSKSVKPCWDKGADVLDA